jgi:hypothetical protein
MSTAKTTTTANKNRKWIVVIGILILIPVFIFGGFGLYGLSQTDQLPWQTQPTRIPITPVELPSFGVIGGTPAPTTVAATTPAT